MENRLPYRSDGLKSLMALRLRCQICKLEKMEEE
ncbi:hypothetical protein CDL12_24518 [Handroanthus impetiginosus]|uniref:Uncharacterized protein n=1 Tax=Handroanthus impetiginosus TaxID=429701 RepID=A0A2G9GCE6_9LAMI|nr:hypothetical protein CDL12_24518 [Handroanthus impetiginosus]